MTKPEQAEEIGFADPRDLVPYAGNARKHSREQIEAMKGVMRAFGFTAPIVVRGETGEIGAGHGRQMAAVELIEEGLTDFESVPVRRMFGWSDAEFRAYVLADNRLSETSEWDADALRIELSDLKEAGFDLDLTGFDEEAIEAALHVEVGPGEFPEHDETIETQHKCPKCGYAWSGKAS